MSGIKDTANVTLTVNGEQAKKMLSGLNRQLEEANNTLTALKANGSDAKSIAQQNKLIKGLEQQIDNVTSAIEGVNRALKNVDTATPRELERAIRHCYAVLKNTKPGTEVWDEHITKIRELKSRLSELKESFVPKPSILHRVSDFVNKWQTLIVGAFAGAGSVVNVFRNSVDAYASMDQEMASVRKFTGQTAEEVAAMNDEFKKMDTRTPREELNKLAQEAGRLGKTSTEDVMGFVRAADKINVALDDLGDGATLTLSKLTGVFGIEEKYGTEKALLKTGSIINELSQNCSASAPYLAEFASRLGGVASQAGLTIQQIMGFGAVLDSSNQAVEASATALSQVMVRIYQDPAKYAKVAGLDVSKFAAKVKTDMNGALLELLETLNKAGGMDVLSPMFKDMGENGSRAIAALSTLASKIDFVKSQQEAANVAFEEGTSIDKEFAVQNNTVQASLEKCKNAANDLRVELGEQLAPLVAHMMTSSTALVRALVTLINYMKENHGITLMTALSIAGWTIALNANIISQKLWAVVLKTGNVLALTVRTTSLALAVVFQLLTGNITKATAAMKLLNTTLKGSLFGIVATGIALAVGKLIDYVNHADEAAKKQAELNKEHQAFLKDLRNIDSKSSEYSRNELGRLEALYKKATDEARSKDERVAAAKRLQQLYPDYFKNLSTEAILVGNAISKYKDLTTAIIKAANARAAQDKIAEIGGQKMDEQVHKKGLEDEKAQKLAAEKKLLNQIASAQKKMNDAASLDAKQSQEWNKWHNTLTKLQTRLSGVRDRLTEINKGLKESDAKFAEFDEAQNYLAKEYGVDIEDALSGGANQTPTPETPSPKDAYVSQSKIEKDAKKRAAAEKKALAMARKDIQQQLESAKGGYEFGNAENISQYGSGLKTYEEFLEKKEALELEYVDAQEEIYKQLYKNESEQDRKLLLMFDEDYQALLQKHAELTNKHADAQSKRKVEDLQREYKMKVAQQEFDFNSPTSQYYGDELAQEERLFRMKQDYLEECKKAYKTGSKEWTQYEEQLQEAEQDHILSLRKSYMQKYEEWHASYSTASAATKMKIELASLDYLHEKGLIKEEEYQMILLSIKKKYADAALAVEQNKTEAKYKVTGPDGDSLDIRSKSEQTKAKNSTRDTAKQTAIDDVKARLKAGLITQDEADTAYKRIEHAFGKDLFDDIASQLDDTTKLFFNLGTTLADIGNMVWDNWQDGIQNVGDIAQATFAVMGAALETYGQFAAAQSKIDIARSEAKYDKEIELAQGNSYKTAKLEKEKEEATAKLKAEATRKEYNIKVITAIAQTAQNALTAYGAGLEAGFPMALWLAPTLAALATANGMVQVALLKKQQQAAEAEGYAEGGFTKPGGKYEPAGIVHAGEWVASQELLSNPVARPMIEALDYAQRTNTIGSLRAEDVSRSITANDNLSRLAEQDSSSAMTVAAMVQNSQAISLLTSRLNEPFVTVNTITGDKGIKQAQDEYDQLVRNKTPKSRRK
jgi:TP901 family phage tail tape measure protein